LCGGAVRCCHDRALTPTPTRVRSALNKVKTFGTDGGPAAQYAGPKLDAAKAALAGFGLPLNALPVENKHLIAVAIALEGLGAALFVLGSELGAQMLVRSHPTRAHRQRRRA
jgi:hypothetical protein